jgi:hypothetical protein
MQVTLRISAMIDYSCHCITQDSCGYWTVSQGLWNLTRGNRPYFINRLPHSTHLQAMSACALEVLHAETVSAPRLQPTALAREFRGLLDKVLGTSSAFVIARKPA